MVAIAGIWYNAAAAEADARSARRGYVLSRASRKRIAQQLPTAPLTYEHRGLASAAAATNSTASTRRALASIGAATFRATGSARALGMQPVGVVTDAWVADNGDGHFAGHILSSMAAVEALVKGKNIGAVSLTHDVDTETPVEITVTAEAARPGCAIEAMGFDAVAAYKRHGRKGGGTTSTMDTAKETPAVTTPEPTPLEAAMSSLDNTARATIEARMEEMVAAADAAAARAKQLEAQGTDYEVMRDQLEQINGQLTDRQRKVYNIEPATVRAQLESHNEQRILGAANRMLMACSARMMELSDDSPPGKRAKHESPAVAAAAPAPEPAPEQSDMLRRALGNTFEMF